MWKTRQQHDHNITSGVLKLKWSPKKLIESNLVYFNLKDSFAKSFYYMLDQDKLVKHLTFWGEKIKLYTQSHKTYGNIG